MSAPATHPCDACGGSGADWYTAHEPYRRSTFPHHPACEAYAPGSLFACECPPLACPVCLGAGSFPDRMPAADALADAETLFRVADETADVDDAAYGLWQLLYEADASLCVPDVASIFSESDRCAHAAFRAVPGLRG